MSESRVDTDDSPASRQHVHRFGRGWRDESGNADRVQGRQIVPLGHVGDAVTVCAKDGGDRSPAIGGPTLGDTICLVDEQHGALEVHPRSSLERARSAEVGPHAEIGANAAENLVDVHEAELGLEFSRSPPEVALQRMLAQVYEAITRAVGEGGFVDHAGQAFDPFGQEPLRLSPGDQPDRWALCDESLDCGQRNYKVTEAV
jgi:hypothetical protein